MNRFKPPILVAAVGAGLLMMSQMPVSAQQSSLLTDGQVIKIKSHCSEVQATLSRVHANDALLRVNRGQIYELISSKLMARLNSRIALNSLDSSAFIDVSTDYERHMKDFRSAYQRYEVSLSDAMEIDCTEDPVKFYEQLSDARQKRTEVFASTQTIADDVKDYKKVFDEFAKSYQGESQ